MKNYLVALVIGFCVSSALPSARVYTALPAPNNVHEIVSKSVIHALMDLPQPGPELKFVRITVDEMKEALKVNQQQAFDAVYKFKSMKIVASGVKEGERYALYSTNLVNPPMKFAEFEVTGGKLWSKDKKVFIDEIVIGAPESGFARGEPMFQTLLSEDNQTCVTIIHIANPIETSWDDGAMASLILAHNDKKTYLLRLKGFKPNEKVPVMATSSAETIDYLLTCNKEGACVEFVNPSISGKEGGSAQLALNRSGQKSENLNFKWGTLIRSGR